MAFNKASVAGITDASHVVRPLHQRHLAVLVGVGDANRLPIEIERRRPNHAPDWVSVSQCLIQSLDENGIDCFTPSITVCFGIKRPAGACGREDALHPKGFRHGGRADQA